MRMDKENRPARSPLMRAVAILLLALCCLSACSFRPTDQPPVSTDPKTEPPKTTGPVTKPPVTTNPPVTNPPATSTTKKEEPPVVYPYVNPLTGEGSMVDLTGKRPLAVVMVNEYLGGDYNQTVKQAGIGAADIVYEYPVEGSATRLLAIYSNYEAVGEIGGIRSGRYYDIQIAKGHDAIYASAGGSDFYKISEDLMKFGAYYYFLGGLVDYLDFQNDKRVTSLKLSERKFLTDLGVTKSAQALTVSGADFAKAIKELNYSTTLSNAYDYSYKFQKDGMTLYGNSAKTAMFYISSTRRVDFLYNGNDGLYYRNQFSDDEGLLPHCDGVTGQQLTYSNVLILFTEVKPIAEDAKSSGNAAALDRKYVDLIGTGTGYYITAGTYTPIKWSKLSEDAPFTYTDLSNNEISFNVGKTFVEIVPETFRDSVVFK